MTISQSTFEELGPKEPTHDQVFAAYKAIEGCMTYLDMTWEAKSPVQGERSTKVLAYWAAKAVVNL